MQSENNNKILRTAIYIRVSSEEQAKNGDSMRDQKETCLHYIETHANTVLQDVYIDDGISGQKLERNEFTRLLQNVRDDKIDFIIFTKLDRWFRSLRHYLNTQATLEKYHVSWLAVDQPYFDTSTPHGRAFVAQSMTWAELEAQNDGIRVRDVLNNKAKNGEVITGKVPRGYRIENKHLVLSDEADAISSLFDFYVKTQSIGRTLAYARDTFGIVMTFNNLRQSVFRNIKYTGRYRANDNYCPRIVSDVTFNKVQEILDRNMNVRTSQKYAYIFSGLLICAECGKKMTGCHIHVKSKQKYVYNYPAYECKNYRQNKACSNGGEIRESRIEEYLLSHIHAELEQYTMRCAAEKESVIDNRLKKSNIRKKMNRLKELYLNELITLDEYKQDYEAMQSQLDNLPDIVEPNSNLSIHETLLDNGFENIYMGLNNEERRAFWRSIVREIHVSGSINRHRKYTIVFL